MEAMPLALLFFLAYLVLCLVAAGSVAYSVEVLGQSLLESGTSAGVALALLAPLFLYLWLVIARPMRALTTAVGAFAKDGTRLPLTVGDSAPSDVRTLALSLLALIEAVDKVHKRDAEVSRVKSDFISTAAHQLRTPLTGIRWALEALEKDSLTEEQRSLVKSATDKSHELVAIVGTLLDISSIESGKYKYSFESVNLDALVAEIVNDLQPLAKVREVLLQFQHAETILPQVRADRERMKWVVTNLVENAIRYTPGGGSVTLSISTGPGRLYLMVRDTGIGIAAEDRGNIFERFYRAQNAVAKENQGNGLGLYIARTIATDHGGDLNFAANKEGPGTTFTLSLPVQ